MNFFLIFLAGLFTMLPLVYAVCTSFKPLDELMIFPPRFFVSRPTLENYLVLPELMASLKIPLSRYIFNSIFVSVVTSLVYILVSAMAAFVLSKATFYGRNVLFWIVQFALMFQCYNACGAAIFDIFKASYDRYILGIPFAAYGRNARSVPY